VQRQCLCLYNQLVLIFSMFITFLLYAVLEQLLLEWFYHIFVAVFVVEHVLFISEIYTYLMVLDFRSEVLEFYPWSDVCVDFSVDILKPPSLQMTELQKYKDTRIYNKINCIY